MCTSNITHNFSGLHSRHYPITCPLANRYFIYNYKIETLGDGYSNLSKHTRDDFSILSLGNVYLQHLRYSSKFPLGNRRQILPD